MRAESLQLYEDLRSHILARMKKNFTRLEIAPDTPASPTLTAEAKRENIPAILKFLRDDPSCAFTILIDLCGVDYPEREKRFDLVYHLLSMTQNARFRLKTPIAEKEEAPSAIAVYPAAAWYEREVFDLYGVRFSDNPDMRRILTDYGFEGHPLRKDFPLTGFTEVRYDDAQKKVVYEPVRLAQEYRRFDFTSPWEGMDSPARPATDSDAEREKPK